MFNSWVELLFFFLYDITLYRHILFQKQTFMYSPQIWNVTQEMFSVVSPN